MTRNAIFILFALGTLSSAARAQPVVVPAGQVVLPITGLAFELPAHPDKGASWHLTASWNLTPTGDGFDGRDVIDEKVGDAISAGTWVHVGFFHSGQCTKVVRTVELDRAWESKVTIAGREAVVRGGVFEFDSGGLGRRPAAVLCFERGARKQLLMHRFFLDQPEAMTQEAMLEALGSIALIDRVVGAWVNDRFDTSKPPLRRVGVRRRGGPEASREVRLENAGFSVKLPDDGLVWLRSRPAAGQETDWLDLMAPSLPEVSVEIVVVRGASCDGFFGGLTVDRRKDSAPKHVPAGWLAGPTLIVDGEPELTTCKPIGADALVVGLFVQPFSEDIARYGPLLEALATGAAAR